MSRYIDADALAYKVAINSDADFINKVTKFMVEAPSIYIVKCKECENHIHDDWCIKFVRPMFADDFCSRGERREP